MSGLITTDRILAAFEAWPMEPVRGCWYDGGDDVNEPCGCAAAALAAEAHAALDEDLTLTDRLFPSFPQEGADDVLDVVAGLLDVGVDVVVGLVCGWDGAVPAASLACDPVAYAAAAEAARILDPPYYKDE